MYRHNKVFLSSQFKSSDSQQKLLSGSVHDPFEPNVMRRRKWPVLVLFLFLLVIAICTLPMVSRFDVAMEGAEITPEGSVIQSGQFSLEGREYNYLFRQDLFQLNALQLPGCETGQIIRQTSPIHRMQIDLFLADVQIGLPEYSEHNLYIGNLLFPEDRSWFVLQIVGRTFVCFDADAQDLTGILERCGSLL